MFLLIGFLVAYFSYSMDFFSVNSFTIYFLCNCSSCALEASDFGAFDHFIIDLPLVS